MPSNKAASVSKTGASGKKSAKSAKPVNQTENEPRQITPLSYRSRLKRTKAARTLARNRLPNSFLVFYRSLRILVSHWEVFGGILLIYVVINMLMIGGFSSGQPLEEMKATLAGPLSGNTNQLVFGLALFGFLIQSGSTVAGETASALFQTAVLLVVSLAIVWSLRQFHAGNRIRIRDAFYQSTYPLIQVLLVVIMVFVQLIPAVLGGFLFSALVVNGVLVDVWQQVLCGIACLAGLAWTFYMLTASLFAAYIVTLPDMTPLAAMRSAREIVRHRRGMVLLKVAFLPLALFIIAGAILVPLVIFASVAATAVYFVLAMLSPFVVHAYMYNLYRELIAE